MSTWHPHRGMAAGLPVVELRCAPCPKLLSRALSSPMPPLAAPGAAALACSCGAITGLDVGFVLVDGAQYVSTIGIECGSGESLPDPAAARIGLVGTVPSRVVSGGLCNAWKRALWLVRSRRSTPEEAAPGLPLVPLLQPAAALPLLAATAAYLPTSAPPYLPGLQCPDPEPDGGCTSLTGSIVGVADGRDELLAFSRLQDAGAPSSVGHPCVAAC